jgi:hypothetical protein
MEGFRRSALNKYRHTPRVGIGFIEIEVDATNVWGLEDIHADTMRE